MRTIDELMDTAVEIICRLNRGENLSWRAYPGITRREWQEIAITLTSQQQIDMGLVELQLRIACKEREAERYCEIAA